MQTHSVSIVIPTYNRLVTLQRAMASVMAQSYPHFEVIVIDDGSTDATFDWIKSNHPEVTLITQDNHGVSHARNRGIEVARGDWIALLDSDDAWHPDKLNKQLDHLSKHADAVLCHTDELWFRNGKRVNPANKHTKLGGHIFEACLALCLISPSSVLIHKDIFAECGYFDEDLPACEDYDLWLRITARYPVLFLDEPLTIKHGGHADQLSQKYWGMDRFRIHAICKLLQSGTLPNTYKESAREMMQKKIKIYCQGARKRGKSQEVAYYEKLHDAF